MIDEQINILTQDQLELAVDNVIDVIEDEYADDSLDERDLREIARDLGYQPTPQLIEALKYALEW
jgi:hypothetical protein